MRRPKIKPLIDELAGGPCQVWQFRKTQTGYGKVRHNGRVERAHRAAFCAANGLDMEDIKGMHVLHRCDNPSCVNPAHLFLGSHADNMRDMDEKGRRVIVRGERQGSSKLSEKQVEEIRRSYVRYDRQFGTPALAKKFGVNTSTINSVVNNKTWTHIKGDGLDREGN